MTEPDGSRTYASWSRRAAAYLIDAGLPAAILGCLFVVGDTIDWPTWFRIASAAIGAAVVAIAIFNLVYRQGENGSTVGKTVFGIRTISIAPGADGVRLGSRKALMRQLAHCVDTAPLLIGWIWPLRDAKRQTFADKIAVTVVVTSSPESDSAKSAQQMSRRLTAVSMALVALACAAVPSVQYFHQYRPESATENVDSMAAKKASDGAVALLSYKAETVQSDLEASQKLLTGQFLDYYQKFTREVVIPAAQEKKVSTQATVSSAAVTSAAPDSATVILFVNQLTTTASAPEPSAAASTLRVTLTKVGDNWLISALDPI